MSMTHNSSAPSPPSIPACQCLHENEVIPDSHDVVTVNDVRDSV